MQDRVSKKSTNSIYLKCLQKNTYAAISRGSFRRRARKRLSRAVSELFSMKSTWCPIESTTNCALMHTLFQYKRVQRPIACTSKAVESACRKKSHLLLVRSTSPTTQMQSLGRCRWLSLKPTYVLPLGRSPSIPTWASEIDPTRFNAKASQI